MQDRLADIRAAGGELVAVSLSQPTALAAYLAQWPRPFPVVADPDRAAYRAFGLDRGGWRMFFSPRVLLHYLRLLGRAPLRWPNRGEDLRQLGGDFVVDAGRRVVFAHRSRDPADRPAVADLVRAVAAAGAA